MTVHGNVIRCVRGDRARGHHIEYMESRPGYPHPGTRRPSPSRRPRGDPSQPEQYHAAALNATVAEVAGAIEEYPMPAVDEPDSVPVEEFYEGPTRGRRGDERRHCSMMLSSTASPKCLAVSS
jgi:hypothetical protein